MTLLDWYCPNCDQKVRPKERPGLPVIIFASVGMILVWWYLASVGIVPAISDPVSIGAITLVLLVGPGSSALKKPRRACPICGTGRVRRC